MVKYELVKNKRVEDGRTKRILTISHGITQNTGFAKCIRYISKGFVKAGYEVFNLHTNYSGEPIKDMKGYEGITILPKGADPFGQDVIPFYIDTYKPDIILTLCDIWNYTYFKQIQKNHKWRHIWYYEVDTENVTEDWVNNIRQAEIPVVAGKFAKNLVERTGTQTHYIPHGYDPEFFHPVGDDEKNKIRAGMGLRPDDFVVLTVAHNQFRKKLDRALMGFKQFVEKNGGNPRLKLVLHSSPHDAMGWNLGKLIKEMGLQGHVLFTDRASKNIGDLHVDEAKVADLYKMADCFYLLTGGEGFGMPFIEAMACGILPIGTDFTTPREFFSDMEDGKAVQKRGILIPPITIEYHPTGGVWGLADVRCAGEALDWALKNPAKRTEMALQASKWVKRYYTWDYLQNAWNAIVEAPDDYLLNAVDNAGVKTIRV